MVNVRVIALVGGWVGRRKESARAFFTRAFGSVAALELDEQHEQVVEQHSVPLTRLNTQSSRTTTSSRMVTAEITWMGTAAEILQAMARWLEPHRPVPLLGRALQQMSGRC